MSMTSNGWKLFAICILSEVGYYLPHQHDTSFECASSTHAIHPSGQKCLAEGDCMLCECIWKDSISTNLRAPHEFRRRTYPITGECVCVNIVVFNTIVVTANSIDARLLLHRHRQTMPHTHTHTHSGIVQFPLPMNSKRLKPFSAQQIFSDLIVN